MSTEVESFLDNNAVNNHQQEQQQRRQNQKEQLNIGGADATIAPYAAELEEEEAIDETEGDEESDADVKRSSWLRTFWIISLYIPFLIQCIFGASFYIIRTLLLGYLLQYILQFFAVAEHWTVQWLGINDRHGKNNSTPLPVLIGLGLLTVLALIVHPDGYTWVILRKVRCVQIQFCFDFLNLSGASRSVVADSFDESIPVLLLDAKLNWVNLDFWFFVRFGFCVE